MFSFQGIWFPDGEKHFPEWMAKNGETVEGRGTYQIKKFREAMKYVRNFRVAVDVGAHVGLWSIQLEKRFDMLHAFEPVEQYRECFERNLFESFPSVFVILHECALGDSEGKVSMTIPSLDGGIDSGGTHVSGDGDIELKKLDGFELQDVDFIKIDCEGYEHKVIAGGMETIRRCKPVVIVEQKPHKLGPNFGIYGTPAVDILKSLGYKVAKETGGDYIMTP